MAQHHVHVLNQLHVAQVHHQRMVGERGELAAAVATEPNTDRPG